MKSKILFPVVLLIILAAIFSACTKEKKDDNGDNTLLTPREQAIEDYVINYLGSACADPQWTGSVNGCNAGSVSQNAHDMVVKRINYFRTLVGLPGDVTLNAQQNSMCQDAVLIMKANNNLSHFPPQSWYCWTQAGYDAAGGSNIAWGSYEGPNAIHASNAVTGYIEDAGAGNKPVGHRAWLLYPQLKAIGHGSTSSTNCLMWKDNLGMPPTNMPEFVAYPPEEYMPAPLVFERWSFSIPNANFSSATVTMKDASNNDVSLNIIHVAAPSGAPDARIVWKPNGINTSSPDDQIYTVTVAGITGATSGSYTYDVIIFQPSSKNKSQMLESRKPNNAEILIK